MKKWIKSLLVGMMVLTLASPAMAASSKGRPSLGGTSSSSTYSTPSSSLHSGSTSTSSTDGKVYNSGAKRPSSAVTNQQSPTYTTNQPSQAPSYAPTPKRSGVGSFLGGMAVGGLLGSMFHPFGGSMYGGGMHGLSLSGLLLDAILIAGVIWMVRRLFRRA